MTTRWMNWALCGLVAALASVCWAPGAMSADTVKAAITSSTTVVAPFYIAQAKGYFTTEGLDVQFVKFTDQVPLVTAVVSGDVDIGATGFTAGFFNVAGAGDVKVVAGIADERKGFHSTAYVVSNAAYAAGLTAPADLKGRKVGIPSLGTTLEYQLLMLGKKDGFTVDQTDFVATGSHGNTIAAIKQGSLEAGIVPGLIALDLQSSGGGKIIGWIGDETPMLSNALLAGGKFVGAHGDTLAKVLRALMRANQDYNTAFQQLGSDGKPVYGANADELLDIIAKGSGVPLAAVKQSLPYMDPNLTIDPNEVAQQIATWKSLGLVNADVDPAAVVDASIVAKARSGK